MYRYLGCCRQQKCLAQDGCVTLRDVNVCKFTKSLQFEYETLLYIKCLQEYGIAVSVKLMLTVSIHQAPQLNERRIITGAMLVDKVKLNGVCALWRCFRLFIRVFCALWGFCALPAAPTTEQKVNFTFDLATYFLFLVRGLVSYQDEGKYQDGGSAVRGPTGCQVRR